MKILSGNKRREKNSVKSMFPLEGFNSREI